MPSLTFEDHALRIQEGKQAIYQADAAYKCRDFEPNEDDHELVKIYKQIAKDDTFHQIETLTDANRCLKQQLLNNHHYDEEALRAGRVHIVDMMQRFKKIEEIFPVVKKMQLQIE